MTTRLDEMLSALTGAADRSTTPGRPKLVEHFRVPSDHLGNVSDEAVAVYIGGEYAGRLQRWPGGWRCDTELEACIPWPRGSRGEFVSAAAALRTIRRRIQDAVRELRIRRRIAAARAERPA